MTLFFADEAGDTKGFLILVSDAHAHAILQMPECLRGFILNTFVTEHSSNLRATKPQSVMILRARMHFSNIVKVESRHATLRRTIVSRSIQTHGLDFSELCGEWRCRNVRTNFGTSVTVEAGVDASRYQKMIGPNEADPSQKCFARAPTP